ncbi:MAG: hypothetical protein KatS3mg024_1816 [Armatimonadota bacterium]|nr:MAG: hypothetical protein KatS3mg024_1816 [Armatimonadota bacterium]
MEEIFGERYRKDTHWLTRVRYMEGDSNVPFAGFVHPESPTEHASRISSSASSALRQETPCTTISPNTFPLDASRYL